MSSREQFRQPENIKQYRQTPERLRAAVDKSFKLFCKKFEVEGKEKIETLLEKKPDARMIIASSHISDLDVPAAIKALGDRVNIQVTAESLLFGMTPQEIMFRAGGKDSFSSLQYKKMEKGKTGVFNPDDFDELEIKIQEGKTPWMAIHPFTLDEEMKDSRIGSVYLAHKTNAKIIPTALETKGIPVGLHRAAKIAQGLYQRATAETEAIYHIGDPVDLPDLDVSIIETVLRKRAAGETVNSEEREEFRLVHKQLKVDADQIAEKIAEMLPEELRGEYNKTEFRKKPNTVL